MYSKYTSSGYNDIHIGLEKKQNFLLSSAPRISPWSPTVVSPRRYNACLPQSGRDRKLSSFYGRTHGDALVLNTPVPTVVQSPVPPLQQRTLLPALPQVLPHMKVVLSGGGKSLENTAFTARGSDYGGGNGFGDCGVVGAGSGNNVVVGHI